MREIKSTERFREDYKRSQKRDKDLEKLAYLIDIIAETGEAPQDTRPHRLSGDWANYWQCRIEPDWLLIYDVDEENVWLIGCGTHSDLFG